MGFFDKFKKKNKEDKSDKKAAEMQAKNDGDDDDASMESMASVAGLSAEHLAALGAEDTKGVMDAFSAMITNSVQNAFTAPAAKAQPAPAQPKKTVISITPETAAAYDAASALFDERGWDDEVVELYQKAADMGHPYACQLLGEYYSDGGEEELSEHYNGKARAMGIKC
ncbi:MAG: hypothetical protein FWH03_01280 [Firmicutes bacterium]|nr:hypothetical protein [Bacillota bacterium]